MNASESNSGVTLVVDLAEEAKLSSQLKRRLPVGAFQRLTARLEDMAHPSERVTYLTKVADALDAYASIVREADRIILAGPSSAELYRDGTLYRAMPVNWHLLSHIALSAGSVRIGYTRLERDRVGRDGCSSDPTEPSESSSQPPDSAAARRESQVELIVIYEADGAQFMPRIRGEELLEFRLEGQVMEPPAPTLDGIYRWLGTNGYVPDGDQFKWLDRREGRRRRRQVYVYEPREPTSERRLTRVQAWDAARGYRLADL
jgi:hypothetical protein